MKSVKKATLVGSIVLFSFIFFGCEQNNEVTDDEKVDGATESVIEKNYTEALKTIDDVHTSRADALREYIKVCKARDQFMEVFDVEHLVKSGDGVYEKMYDFKTKIIEFDEESFIELIDGADGRLKDQCEAYIKGIEYSEKIYEKLQDGLIDYFNYFRIHNMQVNGEMTVNRYDLKNHEVRDAVLQGFSSELFSINLGRSIDIYSSDNDNAFKAFDNEIGRLDEILLIVEEKEKSMAKD